MKALLSILLIIAFTILNADENGPYPEVISNNFGEEFYLSLPPNLELSNSDNDKVHFIFLSPFDTKVYIEIPGKGYRDSVELSSYESIEYTLPDLLAQPFVKSGFEDNYEEFLFKNAAIRFTSKRQFSISVLSDFEESSDAFLALPTKHAGTSYVISPYQQSSNQLDEFNAVPAMASIIATEDNTLVKFKFGGDENFQPDITRPPITGKTIEKTLNKGDVWLVSTGFLDQDISGSLISSDKSITVISANQCASIPNGTGFCNYIINSELPINNWGKKYIVSRIENRDLLPVVRVHSSKDSTIIFKNGIAIDTLFGPGGFNGQGYIEIARDTNEKQEPYILSSNYPIQVVVFNTGSEESKDSLNPGGPFMASLPPVDIIQEEILFTTPNFTSDISFPVNFASVSIPLGNSTEMPEDVQFGILRDGLTEWEPLNENARIISASLVSDGIENFANLTLRFSFAGFFKLKYKKGISALLYGSNGYQSYSFPSSQPMIMNDGIDEDAPLIEWSMDCNGKITGTIYDDSPVTNSLFDSQNSSNYSFNNFKIDEDHIPPRNFEIEIDDPRQDGNVTIHFWDSYRNKATLEAEYIAPKFHAEPAIIEALNIKPGESFISSFTIFNDSETDTLKVNEITFNFNENIQILYNGEPLSSSILIDPLSSSSFNIEITLDENQEIDDLLVLNNSCIDKEVLRVIARAESPEIIVTDVDLGNIVIGKLYVYPVSILNNGKTDLVIYSNSYPKDVNIQVSGLPLIENGRELIIPSGETLDFSIAYNSVEAGIISDSIVFHSDASRSDSICYINATVIEPDLVAPNFDWGRKKILDNKYIVNKYSSGSEFVVTNEGNSTVQLENIYIQGRDPNSFDLQFHDPITLDPGDEHIIELYFEPRSLGLHEAELQFIVNGKASKIVSRLTGFGTRPKLEANSVDFGKVVENEAEYYEANVVLNNLDQFNWQFFDNAEHLEFIYDQNEFNEFGLEIGTATNNLSIEAGEEKIIPIKWTPQKFEFFDLDLVIKGDIANDSIIVKIQGELIDTDLEYKINNTQLSSCLGESDTSFVTIENFSRADVQMEGIEILVDINASAFTIADDRFTKPFIINSFEKVNVPIIFTSFGHNSRCDLLIKQRSKLLPDTLTLFGENKLVDTKITVIPLYQEVVANQIATQSIVLNSDDILGEAEINNLTVTVEYNRSFLKIDENSLIEGNAIQDKFIITDSEFHDLESYFKFTLTNIDGDHLKDPGSIADFNFSTFVPYDTVYEANILIKIETNTNKCIEFNMNEVGKIELSQDCGLAQRRVVTSENITDLEEVSPNPISENSKVKFSVAHDLFTNVSIFNSNGELVFEAVDQKIKAGAYEFLIPYSDLTSGIYYCSMHAGNFTKTIPLILNK